MLSYFYFLSAFGAATLLPLQSEAVLATLLLKRIFCFSSNFFRHFRKRTGLVCELVAWFKIEHFKHKSGFLFLKSV